MRSRLDSRGANHTGPRRVHSTRGTINLRHNAADVRWSAFLRDRPSPAAMCRALGWQPWQKAAAPRVYDAFMYNGEAQLFALRAAELRGVVARHVYGVTERTYRGERRREGEPLPTAPPLATGAAPYRRVVMGWNETEPNCRGYKRPIKQSSCRVMSAHNNLARGLRDAQDDDWVVFGDLDELPDPSVVASLAACDVPADPPVLIFRAQHHFIYSLRCVVTGGQKTYWTSEDSHSAIGPLAMRVSTMRTIGLQAGRYTRYWCVEAGDHANCTAPRKRVLPRSSWHLSSCFDTASIIRKLQSNMDQGYRVDAARAVTDIDRLRGGCRDPRGYYKMKTLAQPLSEYPDIPRALASRGGGLDHCSI
eukprot:Transcript_19325.p1 GENE.Transcript_19325~~Transcript_19325.p1  ORF type:complete len:363 (-),score=29.32 Transcript_19325:49-1137(-)